MRELQIDHDNRIRSRIKMLDQMTIKFRMRQLPLSVDCSFMRFVAGPKEEGGEYDYGEERFHDQRFIP
jgi:hypothetical protein